LIGIDKYDRVRTQDVPAQATAPREPVFKNLPSCMPQLDKFEGFLNRYGFQQFRLINPDVEQIEKMMNDLKLNAEHLR